MAKKEYDLAVKIGNSKNGKAIWKNIGVAMRNENGIFLLIDKTFNPAGVQTELDKTAVRVSMFQVKENEFDYDNQQPPDEFDQIF